MPEQRPRLVVLFEFPTSLGGERSLLEVVRVLSQEFHWQFLAPAGGNLEELIHAYQVPLQSLKFRDSGGKRLPDEQILQQLLNLVPIDSCDLLHANSLTLARFLGRIRQAIPRPVTAHIRDVMNLSRGAITDLNRLQRLICVSDYVRNEFVRQGVNPDRLTRIYNGIELTSPSKHKQHDLRQELGLPESCQLAATIGQIVLRKGHDTLVKSILDIAPQQPNWHFLIIGECYSQKIESLNSYRALQQTIDEAGLSSQVHWLGYRNDVQHLLPQIDLLIHPARQEPFGRVLLEAAAAGIPIIATAVGGTPEMLVDGKSARLIDPDNPRVLIQQTLLLMQNQSMRRELGQAAQTRVCSNFKLSSAAVEHLKVWQAELEIS